MLDVHLLGRGGMYPLPKRFLTALLVRFSGEALLVDCGEGTQVAIRAAGLGFKQIGTILITHFHADHITGLPGLLLTIGNSDRTDPVRIIGPAGLRTVVEGLLMAAPFLPFEIEFQEILEKTEQFSVNDLFVTAQAVKHNVPCYAYRFDLLRAGKFNPEKAQDLGVPVNFWGRLQKGESVTIGNKTIESREVMGAPRKGISLVYATDLRPSKAVVTLAQEADLFICEGNYGDPEKRSQAIKNGHCLFSECAEMAQVANAKELWLTHFSPSMMNPEDYLQHATEIFLNTRIDRASTLLRFPE